MEEVDNIWKIKLEEVDNIKKNMLEEVDTKNVQISLLEEVEVEPRIIEKD